MRRLIKYLFPPLATREKLPLPPREYKAKHSIYGELGPELDHAVAMLIGHGAARDKHHAARLLRENPQLSVSQIIRRYKRKRQREPRWIKALRRLKDLW